MKLAACSAKSDMIAIVRADSPERWAAATRLVSEYAASLDVALDFQDFDHELRSLSTEYAAPNGSFMLAQDGEHSIGCGGIRRFSESACEMKRLYVSPPGRNRGVGRMLAEALIREARTARYQRVLLDTLPSMQGAQALYRLLGFQPVAAYRFNPVPGASFMILEL